MVSFKYFSLLHGRKSGHHCTISYRHCLGSEHLLPRPIQTDSSLATKYKVEGAIQVEEKVTEKEAEMNNIEKNKSEWEKAANTIGRICLVLSLLGTIALLLFLTIGINLGD